MPDSSEIFSVLVSLIDLAELSEVVDIVGGENLNPHQDSLVIMREAIGKADLYRAADALAQNNGQEFKAVEASVRKLIKEDGGPDQSPSTSLRYLQGLSAGFSATKARAEAMKLA